MRTAPAVTVRVVPDPVWRAGLSVLGVLVGALLPAWAIAQLMVDGQPDLVGWLCAVVLAGVSVATVRAVWRLRRLPCKALSWNGQVWQLLDDRSQATPVTVSVSIDTGGWMLLRAGVKRHPGDPSATHLIPTRGWRPGAARPIWIALSERRLPQSWHALRCAVHGPPPAAANNSADIGARS